MHKNFKFIFLYNYVVMTEQIAVGAKEKVIGQLSSTLD